MKRAGLGDRKVLTPVNSSHAGKGDDPRPVSQAYYDSPLWDVMGPDARKRRERDECSETVRTDKTQTEVQSCQCER